MRGVRRFLPLLLALGLFAGAFAVSLVRVLRACEGSLVYSGDDAYIHMAVAKNLARHGVWGVTPHGFTSVNSSLLWVVLLGGLDRLFGVSDLAPLLLNLAACLGLLGWLDRRLRARGVPPAGAALTLAATVLGVPLAVLCFTGQEHVLHALLSLAFVARLADQLRDEEPPGARAVASLGLLAGALVATRYEGLFLAAPGLVLLWLRGRRAGALKVAALCLLPITAFGIHAMARGWYFLPNSVLTKGNLPRPDTLRGAVRLLGYDALTRTVAMPEMLVLLAGALLGLAVLLARGERRSPGATACGLFAATALLHMQLARVGYFYRYEGYLVALGLYALAEAAPAWRGLLALPGPGGARRAARAARFALLAVAGLPLLGRALDAHRLLPLAVRNVREQHLQMARFVARYYTGEVVALNDIGAVNYYADIGCVDLWGLASMDAARLQLRGGLSLEALGRLAEAGGARIAILYLRLPPPWIEVARWRIRDNLVCAGDAVSFYAKTPAEARTLGARLRQFEPELPAAVERSYLELP